eukprot:m.41583 g.41583  ORF g.41583 m.41583 type:complete len:601 (+) comp7008_c0_seq1:43-1845(+)
MDKEVVLSLCGPSAETDVFRFDGVLPNGVAYKINDDGQFTFDKASFGCDDVICCTTHMIVYKHENVVFSRNVNKEISSKLVALPEQSSEVVACVGTDVDAAITIACFVREERDGSLPIIYPHIPEPKTIKVWRMESGWETIAVVTECAERLCISPNGQHVVFAVMKNHIPEEGERGNWFICATTPAATPQQFTIDAGRVGEIGFTANGSHILYTANYSMDRPITTHCPLFAVEMKGNDTTDVNKQQLTPSGSHVQVFVSPNEKELIYTLVEGTLEVSFHRRDLLSAEGETTFKYPVCCEHLGSDENGDFVYITESATIAPSLATSGGDLTVSKFSDVLEQFQIEVVSYTASDGTTIESFHCFTKDTKKDAPLLVNAHGGPAVPFPARRSLVMGNVRYTYRQLLAAGYRVIMPLFRGTLGYGDAFCQANINNQGVIDLQDIKDAVAFMGKSFDFGDNVGIFGGSYGGFMTMRALAMTDLFKGGVCMYGFIHSRMMTMEGGDPSWEEEYVGPVNVWPLTEKITKSDVFYNLGKIESPTLFLHGADDDICMPSASLVGYRSLKHRGIRTECVMYPGERHGFDKPEFQRDRDIRVLKWFNSIFL